MNPIDAILMSWIAFSSYKAMQRQYAVQFVFTAATVIALVAALLYTPYLVSKQIETVEELAYEVALEISPAVQVTAMIDDNPSGASFPEPIYRYLMSRVGEADHSKYQQVLLRTANNMLVNLFCFGVIVMAVKALLGLLARFYESRIIAVGPRNTWFSLVLGLLDSLLLLMVLTGFLMPLLLVESPGAVRAVLQESRIIGALLKIFYQMWPSIMG